MPVYIDEEGFSWLVRVKENATVQQYKYGIRIGPPDLSELPLSTDEIKLLQKELVKANLVNAELIHGSTGKLFEVVKTTLPHVKDTKAIVRLLKSIYQHDYYSSVEDL
jgi:hypothetical protein